MACKNILELLAENEKISQAVAATLPRKEVNGPFTFFPIETIPDRYTAPYFFFLRHFWLQKDSIVKSQIKTVLQVYRPDVVHFHNFNVLTFSAVSAVKSAGVPAVLSIYDYWIFCPTNMLIDLENTICKQGHGFHCMRRCLHSQFFKTSHYISNLPIVTRKRYFARSLAMFDRIITLSENSKSVVMRHADAQPAVDVIRLAADPDVEDRPDSQPDERTALFAGWVQARKGPDILVKAMAEVIKTFPDARLNVVGPLCESKFEAYIRKLAKDLGVDDNVNFTGKLPQEQFRELFYKASIIVIAEQWENMSPVFALESMAAGKAIVSGRIGGLPELINDGEEGLLARYDDPSDFADKIKTLFADGRMARRMGQNAKSKVARICDRRVVMKKLVDMYTSAINKKNMKAS